MKNKIEQNNSAIAAAAGLNGHHGGSCDCSACKANAIHLGLDTNPALATVDRLTKRCDELVAENERLLKENKNLRDEVEELEDSADALTLSDRIK